MIKLLNPVYTQKSRSYVWKKTITHHVYNLLVINKASMTFHFLPNHFPTQSIINSMQERNITKEIFSNDMHNLAMNQYWLDTTNISTWKLLGFQATRILPPCWNTRWHSRRGGLNWVTKSNRFSQNFGYGTVPDTVICS